MVLSTPIVGIKYRQTDMFAGNAKQFQGGYMEDKKDNIQVGARVDRELWQRIRAQAALERRTATKVLNDAMSLYLERVKEKGQ
ncbi:MAG: hypothetical protein LC660_12220 [Desulfobacteraceae bacterium]|nr:hypothetical protein [Desulfobacteraceae bacterium]